MKTFRVETYDSYDSPDKRSHLLQGEFQTYREALALAKRIVADFIKEQILSGKSVEDATSAFYISAEVPVILGEIAEGEYFQPYEYANLIAKEMAHL
jgi:hypothetical protein